MADDKFRNESKEFVSFDVATQIKKINIATISLEEIVRIINEREGQVIGFSDEKMKDGCYLLGRVVLDEENKKLGNYCVQVIVDENGQKVLEKKIYAYSSLAGLFVGTSKLVVSGKYSVKG